PATVDDRGQFSQLGILHRVGKLDVATAPAGPEVDLGASHHNLRSVEVPQISDVVVVRVGDDHRRRVGGIDGQRGEGLFRLYERGSVAVRAARPTESRVHHDGARVVADQPEEV